MVVWLAGWLDRWKDDQVDEWMNRWTDEWMERRMDGGREGGTDWWPARQMDGWMNRALLRGVPQDNRHGFGVAGGTVSHRDEVEAKAAGTREADVKASRQPSQ